MPACALLQTAAKSGPRWASASVIRETTFSTGARPPPPNRNIPAIPHISLLPINVSKAIVQHGIQRLVLERRAHQREYQFVNGHRFVAGAEQCRGALQMIARFEVAAVRPGQLWEMLATNPVKRTKHHGRLRTRRRFDASQGLGQK